MQRDVWGTSSPIKLQVRWAEGRGENKAEEGTAATGATRKGPRGPAAVYQLP